MWRYIRAVVLLPGMALVVIPALIKAVTGQIAPGWGRAGPWRGAVELLGVASAGMGLALMAGTIALFASRGHGALAPWAPPRHLVIDCPYRRVRNPMISGVALVLLCEVLLLGIPLLFCWWLLFVCGNAVYIRMVEEPSLVRRFGGKYEHYRANVPRWIPRLRSWQPPDAGHRV